MESAPAYVSRLPPRTTRPQSPSRRRPDRSWRSNDADRIERMMQDNHQRTWGYVIYRTSYSSDDDWAEFLRILRASMEKTFDRCNGRDVLDLFTLTVFSDQARFDGAETPAIRAHFKEWAKHACLTEQQQHQPYQSSERSQEHDSSSTDREMLARVRRSPRYELCIMVDEASLRSVVYEAPAAPTKFKVGWVMLVNGSWLPLDKDPRLRSRSRDPSSYEPVEGITDYDVGFMKVPYKTVMTEYYYGKEIHGGWRTEFCRPPKVVGPPYDE